MASTIPSLVSSNLMKKSKIIPQLYSSIKPKIIRYNVNPTRRLLFYASSGSPPEFPGHGQEPLMPTVPSEFPEIDLAPEIGPSSTPDEIVHTRPDEVGPPPPWPDPLPVPGPDSPAPPLDPPRGPDPLPPPTGPDIMPPDRLPPLDPPPPVDPSGPTIVF